MAQTPTLNLVNPTDHSTTLNASLLAQIQANISAYVSQFLPLAGGSLVGTVSFPSAQVFLGGQVSVVNPPYPHSGAWRTLQDHINDSTVHQASALPIPHAGTHQLAGGDPLYGDQIRISNSIANQTIKNYVDAQVLTATATAVSTPSTYYEIGGGDPLYGNLIAIASASATTDVKTYVDTSISAQIAGGYPTNPTFQTVGINGTGGLLQWTVSNLLIQDLGGVTVLSSDGTNLTVKTTGNAGVINLGNQSSPTAYGTIGANGYAIGSTNIGPGGGLINGSLFLNNDLVLSRTAVSNSSAGAISFAGKSISYNANVLGQFYVAASLTLSGNLTVLNGYSVVVNNALQVGVLGSTSALPGIYSDGTNLGFYALEGGHLNLGYPNTSLAGVTIGPAGSWASFGPTGLTLGASVYGASGASVIGPLNLGSGYAVTSGDLGVARTPTSGQVNFGRTSGVSLDWGVVANNTFSFSASGVLAQVLVSGAYSTGASIYGPTSATVAGAITSSSRVAAGTGASFGSSGYTFGSVGDTGIFSNGPGSLQFYTGSSTLALSFQDSGQTAVLAGSLVVPGNVSTQTLSVSGNAAFGGTISFPGVVLGGGNSITKWRVKDRIDLGYDIGAVTLTNDYPNKVVTTMPSAQIERIWMAALTGDTTGTATTFTIYKNGVSIGQVSFTTGATTASALPTTNPTPIQAGDQLQARCSVAGTAVGVNVTLEISQAVY